MHHRPNLTQAINTLEYLSNISFEASNALVEYYEMKNSGQEFLAARYVVEIVDMFNHYQNIE